MGRHSLFTTIPFILFLIASIWATDTVYSMDVHGGIAYDLAIVVPYTIIRSSVDIVGAKYIDDYNALIVFYKNQSLIAYNLSSMETLWRMNDVVEYTVSKDDPRLVAILRTKGITVFDLFTNNSITYGVRGYTRIWICNRTLIARGSNGYLVINIDNGSRTKILLEKSIIDDTITYRPCAIVGLLENNSVIAYSLNGTYLGTIELDHVVSNLYTIDLGNRSYVIVISKNNDYTYIVNILGIEYNGLKLFLQKEIDNAKNVTVKDKYVYVFTDERTQILRPRRSRYTIGLESVRKVKGGLGDNVLIKEYGPRSYIAFILDNNITIIPVNSEYRVILCYDGKKEDVLDLSIHGEYSILVTINTIYLYTANLLANKYSPIFLYMYTAHVRISSKKYLLRELKITFYPGSGYIGKYRLENVFSTIKRLNKAIGTWFIAGESYSIDVWVIVLTSPIDKPVNISIDYVLGDGIEHIEIDNMYPSESLYNMYNMSYVASIYIPIIEHAYTWARPIAYMYSNTNLIVFRKPIRINRIQLSMDKIAPHDIIVWEITISSPEKLVDASGIMIYSVPVVGGGYGDAVIALDGDIHQLTIVEANDIDKNTYLALNYNVPVYVSPTLLAYTIVLVLTSLLPILFKILRRYHLYMYMIALFLYVMSLSQKTLSTSTTGLLYLTLFTTIVYSMRDYYGEVIDLGNKASLLLIPTPLANILFITILSTSIAGDYLLNMFITSSILLVVYLLIYRYGGSVLRRISIAGISSTIPFPLYILVLHAVEHILFPFDAYIWFLLVSLIISITAIIYSSSYPLIPLAIILYMLIYPLNYPIIAYDIGLPIVITLSTALSLAIIVYRRIWRDLKRSLVLVIVPLIALSINYLMALNTTSIATQLTWILRHRITPGNPIYLEKIGVYTALLLEGLINMQAPQLSLFWYPINYIEIAFIYTIASIIVLAPIGIEATSEKEIEQQ